MGEGRIELWTHLGWSLLDWHAGPAGQPICTCLHIQSDGILDGRCKFRVDSFSPFAVALRWHVAECWSDSDRMPDFVWHHFFTLWITFRFHLTEATLLKNSAGASPTVNLATALHLSSALLNASRSFNLSLYTTILIKRFWWNCTGVTLLLTYSECHYYCCLCQ